MDRRHLAAWSFGMALLGAGATLLWAQPPKPRGEAPPGIERGRLRAEVIRLRTEVEMLRLDYDLARDGLLEELKVERGLKMAGGMMQVGFAIQSAIQAGQNPPADAPQKPSAPDPKAEAEAAEAEKKEQAKEAAFVAERKKELARRYAAWAEKRLDLEDAERVYREGAR